MNTLSYKNITPLPKPLLPVQAFNISLFPNGAVQRHIQDVAERMHCPTDYLAVSVMVSLASIIGRSHQIEPKALDSWRVVPNLWGIIIGDPSQMKSPAVSEALKPLKQAEKQSLAGHQLEINGFKSVIAINGMKEKQAKKDAETLVKDGGYAKAEELLNQSISGIPQEPTPKRFIINDTTVEKLGELLHENSNGFLVYRDEFSGFLKMISNERNPNDRAFYLESWNGDGSYCYDRIGRGTIPIQHMVLSLLGTIQPSVYEHYISQSMKPGAGQDGFAQRFQLAVYPDELTSAWVNVDRKPDTNALQGYHTLVHSLIGLAASNEPTILKFSQSAQLIFDQWRNELENVKLKNKDNHPVLIAHLTKYRSLMPSIALILHLIDHCSQDVVADGIALQEDIKEEDNPMSMPPVSDITTLAAIDWCSYLESHARRIYALSVDHSILTASLILDKIKSNELDNFFSLRKLYRKGWSGLTDQDAVKSGLERLCDHNHIEEIVSEPGGKKTTKYRIHPSLLPTAVTPAPAIP